MTDAHHYATALALVANKLAEAIANCDGVNVPYEAVHQAKCIAETQAEMIRQGLFADNLAGEAL
jgi:hypothetical protein